jgi:hypothetical protein
MQQHAALEVAPGGSQLLGMSTEAQCLALDSFQYLGRQNDFVAPYRRQLVEANREATVAVLLDGKDMPSECVATVCAPAQTAQEVFGLRPVGAHYLDVQLLEMALF